MSYKNDRIKAIPAPLPTDYDRQYRFVDWETQYPDKPKPAAKLDAEFNAIEQALDETQDRLGLIQRDDGALKNRSVGLDQLKEEALSGVNVPDDWAAFTNYAVNDSVIVDDGAWYLCLESHVSSGTFADDLAAGYWRLLLNLIPYTTEAENWASYTPGQPVPEGDGTQESAYSYSLDAAASASAASTSETNAAASETNAADSASAAATSETNAANSASAAASSETAAANSASAASTSETNAAASETAAANSASAASTSETSAGNSATAAANSASAASTSETNAANSASAASTSETNAANSASAASTSETNAANSETAALAYLKELRGRWYGALSSDPTADPNGDPVGEGDAYWHTGDQQIRVYNGTTWEGAFSAADVVSHSSAIDGLADTPTVQEAIERLAFVARHYDAGGVHEAAGQTTIQTPEEVQLRIGATAYVLTTQTALDVNTAANWDDGTNATPANRAGKDFYLYYCQPASGSEPDLILSANSTMPSSIPSGATPTADNTRKIAGFHCLCADVGAISGHPLSGFVAGDVLPRSVWDQFHRPESEPEGMVWSSEAGVWVDIYLASWNGTKMESVYNATIADGASSPSFHWYNFAELLPDGKNLPFQPQFQKMALGSPQETNIAGSADPVTTGGHSDTAGRRIISNIGCEDMTGVLWQWGAEGGATNDVGSAYAVADTTATAGSYDAINGVGRGQHYEAPNRPRFGGRWAIGSFCGSRGSAWNDSPLILSSSLSARGVAEPAKNRRI